jgi:hypothetical protein
MQCGGVPDTECPRQQWHTWLQDCVHACTAGVKSLSTLQQLFFASFACQFYSAALPAPSAQMRYTQLACT